MGLLAIEALTFSLTAVGEDRTATIGLGGPRGRGDSLARVLRGAVLKLDNVVFSDKVWPSLSCSGAEDDRDKAFSVVTESEASEPVA